MIRRHLTYWTACLAFGCIGVAQAQVPSFADLVEQVQPAVVNISTSRPYSPEETGESMPGIVSADPRIENFFNPRQPQQESLGSGFVIDSAGYIITNSHVIEGAEAIQVTTADNRQLEAKLVGRDNKTDIALIKVETADKLAFAKIGDSDKIRVGDWILAIGNPFGLGNSVSAGIVSAKSRDIESGPYDNFIQTDASINQGSSGGPMFNMNGEVIGINTAIFSTSGGSMGIGFAIPVNLTRFVVTELKAKGKVERGWIGVSIQPNSEDISVSVGQPQKQGVVVSAVSEGSTAAKAGVEAGDIITAVDGHPAGDPRSFSRMIAETAPGKSVSLEIWRNKQFLHKNVFIALMPEEKKETPPPPQQPAAEVPAEDAYIAALHLTVANLTPEILNKYHFNNAQSGVVIVKVDSGSDAEAKGLREGNLITEIDKAPVFDINDVRTMADDARLDNQRPLLLQIYENNIPHYAAIKLDVNE